MMVDKKKSMLKQHPSTTKGPLVQATSVAAINGRPVSSKRIHGRNSGMGDVHTIVKLNTNNAVTQVPLFNKTTGGHKMLSPNSIRNLHLNLHSQLSYGRKSPLVVARN